MLLNTAQKEQKELKEEFGEGETIGGTLAEDLAGIGGHLDDKDELRPTEQSAADSIEYVHGSLGIVPSGADDDWLWTITSKTKFIFPFIKGLNNFCNFDKIRNKNIENWGLENFEKIFFV